MEEISSSTPNMAAPEETESTPSPEETIASSTTPEESPLTPLSVVEVNHVAMPVIFPYGAPQSALRPGQTFRMYITGVRADAADVRVDAHELGASPSIYTEGYDSSVYSDFISVASDTPDGVKTYTVSGTAADSSHFSQDGHISIDTIAPTATLSASFSEETPGEWSAHVSGTLNGTGSFARILTERTYGIDAEGTKQQGGYTSAADSIQNEHGPTFSNITLPILPPDPSWVSIGYQMVVSDEAGNVIQVENAPVSLNGSSTPLVSNVLFLPGIKGSRLFQKRPLCSGLLDECDLQQWLPFNSLFAENLFLNDSGTSIENIYAKEGSLLLSVLGTRFYESFIEDMGEAQASGMYGTGWQWRAVPYDWRLSLPDIISKGVERDGRIYYGEATSTPYIEQTLRALASSSPTGKVTIVAHSNGGLVAKALMQKLGDAEASALVDKIVLVAVPQSGAPRALGALLFGDKEGLPDTSGLPNLIMTEATAREFARNSPMAYHLLPSARYFTGEDSQPLLSFSDASRYQKEHDSYGNSIDSWDELRAYGADVNATRPIPSRDEIFIPNILNSSLLSYADAAREEVDAWAPPSGIQVYEVAGWGRETISGIQFDEITHVVLGRTIASDPSHEPVFTHKGDGTVPSRSAQLIPSSLNTKKLWVNLEDTKYDHGNIFEMPAIRALLSHTIQGTEFSDSSITTEEPTSSHSTLVFTLHSPLTLELTDADGNSEGLTKEGISHDEIPGASHGELGEVKYVITPVGGEYELNMHGKARGVFTLNISEERDERVIATSSIAYVPTTEHTVATLSIKGGIENISALRIDEDGDGAVDMSIEPKIGERVFPPKTAPQEVSFFTPSRVSSPRAPKAFEISNVVVQENIETQEETSVPKKILRPRSQPPEVEVAVKGIQPMELPTPQPPSRIPSMMLRILHTLYAALLEAFRTLLNVF